MFDLTVPTLLREMNASDMRFYFFLNQAPGGASDFGYIPRIKTLLSFLFFYKKTLACEF